MIIGISGKIGSGKDTVGRIIQVLASRVKLKEEDEIDMLSYEQLYLGGTFPASDWVIKKYADKLKDIVCLLLGCTREQLEDRDFKENDLGEEWALIRETSSYSSESTIYPVDHVVPMYSPHAKKETLTPRKILQLLGTEAGRQIIHPNIWINATMSDYDHEEDMWIITDMRFPNELEAVKSKGGITIRIERPNEYKEAEGSSQRSVHPSETALDNAEFDYVVHNTGTIGDLINKIRKILFEEGII